MVFLPLIVKLKFNFWAEAIFKVMMIVEIQNKILWCQLLSVT